MRKFTKIVLIVSLILGIAGGVFLAAGIAAGASPYIFMDTMEKSPFFRIWGRNIGGWTEEEIEDKMEEWEDHWEHEWNRDWVGESSRIYFLE